MKFELKVRTDCQVQLKDVTAEIQQLIHGSGITSGTAVLFVPHTTAAVTLNENADPDVVTDILNGLNKLVPMRDDYRHREGNSAAHLKSSLVGCSVQLIIEKGRLVLGTWQGIFFCEFDGPRSRKLMVKLTSA